jgi:hypothetical protein
MPDSDSPPSERPILVSLVHSVLKVVGSLYLTVTILFFLVAILLWGTVVEKNYGATAAKFGVYGSWWFNGLGLILGVNSAAALVRRWPWKLQHMGFIIPHIGLIVLLVGCYLSRRYGIEATLMVREGESSNLAYKSSNQHVELDGQQQFTLNVVTTEGETKPAAPIVVPFTSGPFNWDDYYDGTLAPTTWSLAEGLDHRLGGGRFFQSLASIPWSLAHRDRGVLYDHDGIRLEVLDYLSNSEIVILPSVVVRAKSLGPDGSESGEPPKALRMSVNLEAASSFPDHPYGVGNEQTLPGNQRILFWMTGNAAETAAFRQSKPAGVLGKLGRVVLYAGGKPYEFAVADWQRGGRRPLGDTGLEAEFEGISAEPLGAEKNAMLNVSVHLNIHRGSASHPLVLSAEYPEILSHQDYDDNVFGAYWFAQPGTPAETPKSNSESDSKAAPGKDGSEKTASPGKGETPAKTETKSDSADSKRVPAASAGDNAARPDVPPVFSPPRIDFFQGADQQLYLRTWRAGNVTVTGPLKIGRRDGRITVFRGTADAVELRFSDFQPAERPGTSARALSFDKTGDLVHLRQAYVRLTVDGQSEEFWMPCSAPDSMPVPKRLQAHTVAGKGRRVVLGFVPQSLHLGYSVHLRKAWRKLDPGTRQASFYGSEIDLIPNKSAIAASPGGSEGKQTPKFEKLLVTLNAPLEFADPASPGLSYRMFQSSMNLNNRDDGDTKTDSAYLSGFTLNYDPGRGLTYVGCLLVVGGIFVAYFVKLAAQGRRAKRAAETAADADIIS